MIEHVSLEHGWYYFFRIDTEFLESLPSELASLKNYLEEMLEDCPDEHFQGGPRSSKLKTDLGIEPVPVSSHPVSDFAEEGLEWDYYNTAHSNVQVYMLKHDPGSFAVEAPVWIEKEELEGFEGFFETSEPFSGHIDLIRLEDGKIWIWDYKPDAAKEKYATTQTYFYAWMLSQRTGIPLEKFRCGYFDCEDTYVFKPEKTYWENTVNNFK